MDEYLVLTTTTEASLASKACAVLEDEGIPVMIEHVRLAHEGEQRAGFKVLVPSKFSQTAMRLVAVSERYTPH